MSKNYELCCFHKQFPEKTWATIDYEKPPTWENMNSERCRVIKMLVEDLKIPDCAWEIDDFHFFWIDKRGKSHNFKLPEKYLKNRKMTDMIDLGNFKAKARKHKKRLGLKSWEISC